MTTDVGQEYVSVIIDAIDNHPRSQQVRIGPSEIGHPCARRLAYKLLATPEGPQKPNWKATVGTAIHEWVANVFDQYNLDHAAENGGQERFLIESRVTVGTVQGSDIDGSCDLFDRATGIVTDWKTCGPSQLQKYKRQGPGEQYRAQAHLYGRGWQRAGYAVTAVQVVFLPRNGDLSEAVIWTEPYDESIAVAALTRLQGIYLATSLLGHKGLEQMPTADAWCHLCPYFRPNSDDLGLGCPGDAGAKVNAIKVDPNADPLAG